MQRRSRGLREPFSPFRTIKNLLIRCDDMREGAREGWREGEGRRGRTAKRPLYCGGTVTLLISRLRSAWFVSCSDRRMGLNGGAATKKVRSRLGSPRSGARTVIRYGTRTARTTLSLVVTYSATIVPLYTPGSVDAVYTLANATSRVSPAGISRIRCPNVKPGQGDGFPNECCHQTTHTRSDIADEHASRNAQIRNAHATMQCMQVR